MHSAPFNSRNNRVFSDILFVKVIKFTELHIARKPDITELESIQKMAVIVIFQLNNTCIILKFARFSVYYHNSLQFATCKKHHTRLPNIEDVCSESSLFTTCWNFRCLAYSLNGHTVKPIPDFSLNFQSATANNFARFLFSIKTQIIPIHTEKVSKNQVRFWNGYQLRWCKNARWIFPVGIQNGKRMYV